MNEKNLETKDKCLKTKEIAIVGIQGVPARYGGFETMVENIIPQTPDPKLRYTVFCARRDCPQQPKQYKGARLSYVPLFHANGIQSIPYDILSLLRCTRHFDAILVLGVSGGIFLPIFRRLCRNRLIVNIDGLEHRRQKWGRFARWFLRKSEACAVKAADIVVADNQAIKQYVTDTYGREAALIAYGGDQTMCDLDPSRQMQILDSMGLKRYEYAMAVCRIEPENNCHVTLKAFAATGRPLVFVGNWRRNPYSRDLHRRYSAYKNIRLLDSVYDLDTLYALRLNARAYIHGHSAGGTNPSLVEAMFFGRPILAYDVVYNRNATFNKAYYFSDSKELTDLFDCCDLDGSELTALAEEHYRWATIAREYEALYGE